MARVKEIKNPNTGEASFQEYYQREIYSTCVLGSTFTSYGFFANTESSSLRNYQTGQNIFLSNQGAILGAQLSIHNASYAAITTVKSSAYGDFISEMNKIIEQSVLTITIDSKPNHVALGNSLSKRMPILVDADQFGTATNQAKPVKPFEREWSLTNRASEQAGWWFEPALLVAYGRTISFSLASQAGSISLTALNGAYIKLHLLVEEYPSLNPAEVR